MAPIRYDLAEMERFELAVAGSVRRIEQRLAELRAGLVPLRARWTGDAASAWDHHQRTWDAAAADLTAGLTALHQAISVARANYAATVAANVGMWRA